MSEEMQIDGKTYIPSKQAAAISTYAQDYIGQLARKSLIDARRVGGLWYISMESLEAYKKKADEYRPVPPGKVDTSDLESLISFDGKEYFSASKAAEQTGYTQDYVGQLARGGAILSRQVGNRWYVQRDSILNHKKEKDSLLAAVQTQAVGLDIKRDEENRSPEYLGNPSYSGYTTFLTYHSENKDLIPMTNKKEDSSIHSKKSIAITEEPQSVAIRRVQATPYSVPVRKSARMPAYNAAIASKRSSAPLLLAAAATIIIVLSVGYASVLRKNSVYATNTGSQTSLRIMTASAGELFSWVGDQLEPFLTRELIYQRTSSN